jgi:ketosteroid isomerase-like protein
MHRVFALLIACLALVPLHAASAKAAGSPDERAVAAADEAFYRASLTAKGQAWKDFADEGATLPAGSGKDAIGAYYDKVYAKPGFSLSWHPNYAKVVGDVGVTSGRYESHIQDASGHDQKHRGNYVTVWQRQKDGAWRFVWDGGTQAH